MAQTNKYPLLLESLRNNGVPKCKEATCDLLYQLESVDDAGDLRLSVCAPDA
jgi:hypothetical protein